VNKLFLLIIAVFLAGCSQAIVQKDTVPVSNSDTPPVLFFDDEAKSEVLYLIGSAKISIHVEMFQLGDENVIEALADAASRGIDVKIILSDDPKNKSDKEFFDRTVRHQIDMEKFLEDAGCQVRWIPKRDMYSWHRKIAVFDGTVVFMGSTNWTRTGFQNNSEVNVRFSSAAMVKKYEQVFNNDYSKAIQTYTR
jgi:phosphatidylserine/phosphatidylglycerophosphate/cardiolipin synthase-like enzyme